MLVNDLKLSFNIEIIRDNLDADFSDEDVSQDQLKRDSINEIKMSQQLDSTP